MISYGVKPVLIKNFDVWGLNLRFEITIKMEVVHARTFEVTY